MKTEYILFKRVTRSARTEHVTTWTSFMWPSFKPPGEEWKDDRKDKDQPKEILEFVAIVKSPKEVAEIVRRDPMQRYTLFHGEMAELQVAVPVFMNGIAMDSMSAEWLAPNDEE